MDPAWLDWVKRLHAIAQTGLHYGASEYDRLRYEAVREIAVEMASAGTEAPLEVLRKLFSAGDGYATPRVDVRAAVIDDGRILLVREREEQSWSLPGGWADVGESPSVAAVREAREESGYEVRAIKLVALQDRNLHGHPPLIFHAWRAFFLCERVGGEARTSIETDAAEFFAREALPHLSPGRTTVAQIDLMFEHARNPGLPTAFD
jgi:ADP-ribose pyrophosphatase YjhB (NUDIX family)